MQTPAQKTFLGMTTLELQQYADQLYAKCGGDITSLCDEDHEQLKGCVAQYYKLTGQAWQPSHSLDYLFQ